jgi:hypothetical protein
VNTIERAVLAVIVSVLLGIGVRVAIEATRSTQVRCSPCSDDRWAP